MNTLNAWKSWLPAATLCIGLALLLSGCDQLDVGKLGFGKEESDLPVNTRLGGDFTLTDQDGESFRLASLEGEVVILFFGYTHCPDICPAVLARVAQAYRNLDDQDDADDVQPVFITFDPARDTPAHLKEYLRWFKADIIGLTGSEQDISAVAEQYGVVFIESEGEDDGYDFTHSDYIYLLDRQGRVRKVYPADFDIDEVVNDAQRLL